MKKELGTMASAIEGRLDTKLADYDHRTQQIANGGDSKLMGVERKFVDSMNLLDKKLQAFCEDKVLELKKGGSDQLR